MDRLAPQSCRPASRECCVRWTVTLLGVVGSQVPPLRVPLRAPLRAPKALATPPSPLGMMRGPSVRMAKRSPSLHQIRSFTQIVRRRSPDWAVGKRQVSKLILFILPISCACLLIHYRRHTHAPIPPPFHEQALDDAKRALALKPSWGKAYSRSGFAALHGGDAEAAYWFYANGLAVEPSSAELFRGRQSAIEVFTSPRAHVISHC